MKTVKLSASILAFALLLAYALPTSAQERRPGDRKSDRKEMSERLKAAKIAAITEQVQLTPEEAEKFWPVYNEFESKKEKITQNIMERFRPGEGEQEEPSDEELAEMMEQRFKIEQQLLDLKIEYHKKFMDILPATKVGKLYRAEDHFKRGLMERFRQRDGEGRPEGRGVAPPRQCRALGR